MTAGLFDTQHAAELLGLAPQTLAVLRVHGGGPKYVKLGRRVLYDAADLAAWIEANKRESTSAASEARSAR